MFQTLTLDMVVRLNLGLPKLNKENKTLMEYYIAIDKEDIIWGHGLTKSEALKEGREQISDDEKCKSRRLKVIRATKEVFEDIHKNGYCHWDFDNNCDGEPYWSYDFENEIAFYPEKLKRENVFRKIK